MIRLSLIIRGKVQGVGFRPQLYRLASARSLKGTIQNGAEGVVVELEGAGDILAELLRILPDNLPANAELDELQHHWLDPRGFSDLTIIDSEDSGGRGARIPGDLATCPDCLAELRDPGDRRYRYPFTNCIACGPRFTIARAVPYDRPLTSMHTFPMCPACRAEYQDPRDRRYHAEPIACPDCGPTLRLVDAAGQALPGEPLVQAVALLRAGQVVAVKGLGGFHLAVDARQETAVEELRRRKGRELKPLAVMVRDLSEARCHAVVSADEARLLASTRAPIVLLRRAPSSELAQAVAPGNPYLGLMLPYTPLHHLLLEEIASLVMTSGNLTEEPIAIANEEARQRLAGLADAFLEHDREILVACDDSVMAQTVTGPLLFRRSRGFVPDPVRLGQDVGEILATGGQLKNTFCLTQGREAYLGPHVGDLDHLESYEHYRRALAQMKRLLRLDPRAVVHDLHPDYLTTRFAEEQGLPRLAVQHHHAHLAAVALDHGLSRPLFGWALDGTGYGTDGTIWGGELLLLDVDGEAQRLGHLRPFSLPGGEACIKHPRRTALALLWEHLGEAAAEKAAARLGMTTAEKKVIFQLLQRQLGLSRTTSCGRLFDGVAALCGLGSRVTYEGQPAMELEHCAASAEASAPDDEAGYPFSVGGTPLIIDPAPALGAILADVERQIAPGTIAMRFHQGLAAALARACCQLGDQLGLPQVLLGGGCFQNRLLLAALHQRLAQAGLRPYYPQRIPPNDGGLALGQVAVYAARKEQG